MNFDESLVEKVSRALADPKRLRILSLIAKEPGITCGDVVAQMDVSQPTVSHHLKELTSAGIIRGQKAGTMLKLTVVPEAMDAYVEHLRRLTG